MLLEINNFPKNKTSKSNFEVCRIRFEIIMVEGQIKSFK